MSYSPSTPVTGTAQTYLTSPTYTLSADAFPDTNGKQHAVTALGGTQTGVTVHSVSSPFTLSFYRPKVTKVLNAVTGQLTLARNIPRNVYGLITRKGVTPLDGQPPATMVIRTTIDIPAGADLADAANIRAALSAHIGMLSQQSAGIGDTAVNGVL